MIKNITLAYFSGTGCTKAVCDCFEHKLQEQGIQVTKINISEENFPIYCKMDILIVFFPVYALRMPDIVEKWMKNLPEVNNKSAVIISVSGGGEISPNTACREKCKHLLKKKGYYVTYEKMLVMPSNFAIQADKELNLALVRIMPERVSQIIQDVLAGNENITHPKLLDMILAAFSIAEHIGAKFFGAFIHATENCSGCALCVSQCPKKNIRMKDGKPKFGFRCSWCMKCIYACPCKALSPKVLKFTVLKGGFDLKKMCREAEKNSNTKYKFDRNILWQGAIDYVQDSTYVKGSASGQRSQMGAKNEL